ncbi:helix-turn-helix domain-containing protein [Streptomyces dysideae]|uniref:Transcriptional regulator n=1 Tax=Streptomyces dysideae TaxID=909626 RepID=A0A117S294_9ACTN|nr:AraC family transcriptional regulator [Streptomyces dysideae]KUO22607.1 transcriptional regulator [Streptomyces dysideae]
MVNFASAPIPVFPYALICRDLELAVTTFSTVRKHAPLDLMASPHRIDFHQIALVTEGSGELSADFTPFGLRPGTLFWTRPSQVLEFRVAPDLEASVILFTETFPLPLGGTLEMLDDALRPTFWQLSGTEVATFQPIVSLLREEFGRPDPGLGDDLLRHLLAVLLLRIDQLCRWRHALRADGGGVPREHGHESMTLVRRFRRELERSFRTTRLVDDYAAALSCSTRTLARVCRAATGRSTKDLIDTRVTLEAQRLLVHTDWGIGAIAHHLGFTEVTNFSKFFMRRVNVPPGAFRQEAKGRAADPRGAWRETYGRK